MTEQKKQGRGRPRGSLYPHKFTAYLTARGNREMDALCSHWDTTQAEAVRRLIREKVADLGIKVPPGNEDGDS